MPLEFKIVDEIRSFPLLQDVNPFKELFAAVQFEAVGKGRWGAVLTQIDETGAVPLVRTTTRYTTPAQRFQPIHERLAQQIQERALLPISFNNALIEIYTNAYSTMGSHSDQALDLEPDSFIAVYSCYEHPEITDRPRKLIIESKYTDGDSFAVPLTHNSVVVFSVATNKRVKHKIVLEKCPGTHENRWLGITFRTSKTFLRYRDGNAYFVDDTMLTLAVDEQRREFYQLRGRENNETDFTYPQITYTISESDLMPPEPG